MEQNSRKDNFSSSLLNTNNKRRLRHQRIENSKTFIAQTKPINSKQYVSVYKRVTELTKED